MAFTLSQICIAQEKTVKAGESFKSPDSRFILKIVNDPDDSSVIGGLEIIDSKTSIQFKDSAVTPIFSIKWTPDSTSVILVVHVVGGSEAMVYHYTDGKWDSYYPEPSIGDSFSVIKQTLGKEGIELHYKVRKKSNGRLYVCSFTFHPETNLQTNEKIREIDEATYRRLKLNEAK